MIAGIDKDELINVQKQVIGILVEIIKRYQMNDSLDAEYFQLVTSNQAKTSSDKISEIISKRKQNSKIINDLLKKIEI